HEGRRGQSKTVKQRLQNCGRRLVDGVEVLLCLLDELKFASVDRDRYWDRRRSRRRDCNREFPQNSVEQVFQLNLFELMKFITARSFKRMGIVPNKDAENTTRKTRRKTVVHEKTLTA
ncbi:MAG TPA: hypothetical protein VFN20_06290, partial [Candidatus Acidoferrum sp.]|nr:hypothetical protein [Candidatus Acidoferrum sp.]